MLTVAHLITGLETGGAERMLARLVAAADRTRFRPVVISVTGTGAVGEAVIAAGVPLYSLGVPRGRPDPRALVRLLRILRRVRPDILQTWLVHADLLGLMARLVGAVPKLVWNIRATETVDTGVVLRVLARGSRVPDAVIVNSLAGRRHHEALGFRPRRWVHIPNGFDTTTLQPDPSARLERRRELGLGDDAVAILLPARYHPVKDHENFLAAAALLAARRPEARFALAGAGVAADNPRLTAQIAAHGLADRVLVLGERRDIDRLYSAFDLVTLSSAIGEGFPNVLAEAMSCGVPCVATNSGDAAEIVGEAGMVVPPRDPAALAAGWERITALDPAARQALAAAARARIVTHYGLAEIVSRYETLYWELAGPTKPGTA